LRDLPDEELLPEPVRDVLDREVFPPLRELEPDPDDRDDNLDEEDLPVDEPDVVLIRSILNLRLPLPSTR